LVRSAIRVSGDTTASIGSVADVTVGGGIMVDAGQDSENYSSATLSRLSVTVGITGRVLLASATIGAATTAQMDGDVGGGSLTVKAVGANHTNAVTNMISGGTLSFGAAGTLAEIEADDATDGPGANTE